MAVHPVSRTVVRHDPDDRGPRRDLVSCSGSLRRIELDGQLIRNRCASASSNTRGESLISPTDERLVGVIREPAEVTVDSEGRVTLPMGLLVEAGLDIGARLLAYSDGDGRIVLQREADAIGRLLGLGDL
ncbi:AbrB/MazE/SpoVT family DNA-binding domain-containing protein [Kitasatospora sp. HPMI-4]|uniref:AbrB/MazE/SpoVT family DNA-binding domain-containing protein n=1 Tax=Kitasatospora sp. HPMI-4 TaxID=3448443 RepID=UPI003F198666